MPTTLATVDDIPKLWDAIKFAVEKVFHIEEGMAEEIFTFVLKKLESSMYQCFVRYSDDGLRALQLIAVTTMLQDEITRKKIMWIKGIYSYKFTDDAGWDEAFEYVRKTAKNQGCAAVKADTSVKRMKEIVERLGFTEDYTTYNYKL